MRVYVDTSAWIALRVPRDANHNVAKDLLGRLDKAGAQLVTGWHTIIEFIDGYAKKEGQRVASAALDTLRRSHHVHIVGSEPHLDAALAIFETVKDWNIDVSDCLSFAVMDAYNIRSAFTFDRDFDKAGYERLPGETVGRPTK